MEATATTTTMNASDQVGAAMAPGEDSMRFPLYMRIAGTLACMIIFTIGVTGNLLVPLVVIKTKYLRNSTNLFLINLSIADLLVLIVCMPTMIIELHSRPETWLLGEPMCKVSNYVETLAANGSISTILAISFERYYAICKPLKAGYKCTRLRAAIIICVVWILASILSSPIYMMAKSSQVVYETDKSMVYNCILETDTYWSKMYVFVSMFAFFCLPLLVLMLVYWLISRRLIRENVAMMDSSTTRNHLIDGRTNIAHPSSHHAHLTGGANCHHQRGSNVLQFRRPDHKRASSSSTSATLSSLFNSIRHYNYNGQNATGQDDTCGSSTHKGKHRFGSVLMTQSSATTKISAQVSADHASDIKGGHRRPLVVGKAMSLDYGGSRISGGTTDNDNHAAAAGPMRAVQAADDGQPCWPGNSEIFHSRANTDSSNADVTTTATTSTTDADIQTNCRQGSSSSSPASMARKASLPGWIFSSHLSELMGQLLGISSRLKATGNDHTINQDKTTDNSKSESAFKGDITTGGRHSRRVSAADVSMPTATFCDSVLINGHLPCTGKTNVGISEKEELSKPHSDHDQDQSHLPLMQTTFSSCGGGAGHCSLDSKDIDRSSNQNINRVIKADQSTTDTTNDQPHRRGRGVAGRAGRSETRRRTKRSLESKRQKQCRQDSGDEPRSRFKWVKGFSVSSSTGSTYTNSTFLPSETGSISPSLHNSSSRQHSTPSPPRPVGTDTHRATSTSPETGVELGYPYQSPFDGGGHRGNSRSCSPEKLPSSDRKKVAHFDEVVDVGEIDLTLRHPPRLTNSESCSDPAANTGDSDRSLSPSGSLSNEPAAMSSATKSSWLESLAQCEQHDTHQRSLHRSLVQPRQLCQHDEEGQTDAALLGSKYEGRQDKRTSATYIYGECNDGVDVRTFETDSGSRLNLEVIDACHDSTSHVARAIDSGIDATGIVKSNTTTARARVVRSMTEEHAHQRANYIDELERIRLFPIDAGLTPLQHQCDLNLSSASRAPARHSIVNAHRHINKVNLIAMAHNISDNLHFKRHKQRSGSHPVVSHHMQVHNECNGAAHTEFLTVRDVSKRQQMDSRRQVVAMLAFVVACFFLLFLPYRVFTIWLILSTEEQVQSLGMETYYNIVYFARTLIYLHSAINPIAYNLISTKFRRAFMSILLCRGPATRRNFTADPHRFFPYDSKGQLNANQNRSTGTANANNSGSKGPRSPRDLTK